MPKLHSKLYVSLILIDECVVLLNFIFVEYLVCLLLVTNFPTVYRWQNQWQLNERKNSIGCA